MTDFSRPRSSWRRWHPASDALSSMRRDPVDAMIRGSRSYSPLSWSSPWRRSHCSPANSARRRRRLQRHRQRPHPPSARHRRRRRHRDRRRPRHHRPRPCRCRRCRHRSSGRTATASSRGRAGECRSTRAATRRGPSREPGPSGQCRRASEYRHHHLPGRPRPDAYASGPGSDGAPATFFWVHDGGPAGAGDRAISWLQDPGQPASELEGWCRDAAASYPFNFTPVTLTSGDITVRTSAALPSPPPGPSVNGAYAYTVAPGVTRRDSIAAHFDGGPVGEWSRLIPATGGESAFGGPITCLVIDGPDAWAAGPAATSSDGSTGRSAYLHVRDGGPGGANDAALLWMNDQGQTLATMEGWCESRFDPAELYPLDDGDISLRTGTE